MRYILILLLMAHAAHAQDDKLVLSDGTELRGQVLAVSGQKVFFKHVDAKTGKAVSKLYARSEYQSFVRDAFKGKPSPKPLPVKLKPIIVDPSKDIVLHPDSSATPANLQACSRAMVRRCKTYGYRGISGEVGSVDGKPAVVLSGDWSDQMRDRVAALAQLGGNSFELYEIHRLTRAEREQFGDDKAPPGTRYLPRIQSYSKVLVKLKPCGRIITKPEKEGSSGYRFRYICSLKESAKVAHVLDGELVAGSHYYSPRLYETSPSRRHVTVSKSYALAPALLHPMPVTLKVR